MTATRARTVALGVLRAVRAGELVDRALERTARGLPRRERAWVQELTYGSLRLRGRYDQALRVHVRGRLDRVQADILDILRMGAHQLFGMHGVPAYAAVSQSVDLARDVAGQGAGRFVNAVLNALARSGLEESAFPTFEQAPVDYLATWGSHPRWLLERWVDRWGPESARRLVESNNALPEAYLRIVGRSTEAALDALRGRGIGATASEPPRATVRLDATADILHALRAVPSFVQDRGAGLVAEYAAPSGGDVVVDLAAAPGGKALAMTCGQRVPSVTVAADVTFERVTMITNAVRRVAQQTGSELPVVAVVGDARRAPFRSGCADLVLLDAPCTGTGTFRRHPDGRWRLKERDLRSLVALQRALLDTAAALVRPGGVLVYATCSLEVEENEQQVKYLLEERPDFETDPGPASARFIDANGWLFVTPQEHGIDGAFAARLRRRSHAR